MTNEILSKQLRAMLDIATTNISKHLNADFLIDKIYSSFLEFDFDKYQSYLSSEIKSNLEEWWINPSKGIVKEEQLYAILFEYNMTHWSDIEAVAYGINKWDEVDSFMEDYDMGYNYDFATEFYASPAFTLDYFNCFELLDQESNLADKYKDLKYFDLDGFYELIEYVRLTGMIKVHEVLLALNKESLFQKLNTLDNFVFILGEHDDDAYPVLILNQ